jgi:hypothetical protein
LALVAEDFWVKKPYTDWGEKDAVKLLQNSPWAHEVTVTVTGGDQSGMKSRRNHADSGGDVSNGGPAGTGTGSPGAMSPVGGMGGGSTMGGSGGSSAPIVTGNGGEMGRGGTTARGGGDTGGMASAPSMTVIVRWQSAPVVREALVISRFGHEKADSQEAKDFLNRSVPAYVIAVAGLPSAVGQIPQDKVTEMAKQGAMLRRKDKDPIAAEGAQIAQREKNVDVFFLFPKTDEITLDDKEVEFDAKFGRIEVKRKFKLKEMVVGDKLAL